MLAPSSWVLSLFWFVVGSLWGSFLNVCIYRLPREQSIVFPFSRCPHCEHPIAWYDNVPLLSFVRLGGRCRSCRKSISWRYPLIEGLTAAATVAVIGRFGLSAVSLVYLAFVYGLIVASFVDLEFQIIPDEISVGGLVVGVVLSLAIPTLHGTESRLLALGRSVTGLLVGGGLLYGTGLMGEMIFRKEAMGGGDVKLLAMAGSMLGWKLVLLSFFVAPILALVPGLVMLIWKRSHVIPYGPFLSLALVLSLFSGHALIRASGVEETVRILWSLYGPQH